MAASLTKPIKLTSNLSYRVASRRDVAFLMEFGVVGALDLAVPLGRDDDLGAGLGAVHRR